MIANTSAFNPIGSSHPQYELIKQAVADGEKYAYISAKFTCSPNTLNQIRKQLGLPPRSKKGTQVKHKGRLVYESKLNWYKNKKAKQLFI